ncbi:DUF5931 domain-containing protein [Fodinicola feengrottensis]|uniref:DUF5931 domain-containing protein n=1 Tax=Fodinicola feengrottensis TaxID=435914 RepID=A0ABN2IEU1_9ACTN
MSTLRRIVPSGLADRSVHPLGLELSLWRAVTVYRVITLVLAVAINTTPLGNRSEPASLPWVIGVLAAMTAWTAVAVVLTWGRRPRWWMLAADMAIAGGALLLSIPAVGWQQLHGSGAGTVPGIWVASAILSWALAGGVRSGIVAATVISALNIVLHGWAPGAVADNVVLAYLAGVVVGYAGRLVRRAEQALADAVRLQAATAERERLARHIHDGVLQVLALVSRRGDQLGGDAGQLGVLAGEQEAALRALIVSGPADLDTASGERDLREALADVASARTVTLSTPAGAVPVPARTAAEIADAVRAALDNVRKHVGADAPAWLLVEDTGDEVVVTVRDDGPGIPAGRLEQAVAGGRLGVEQSIRGRIRDLGGSVSVVSAPGEGTEVELRVPKGP